MTEVYLVLVVGEAQPQHDGTTSIFPAHRRIFSSVFKTLDEAKQSVQIVHDNRMKSLGQPTETITWENTIPKRPNGQWLMDVELRIEPVIE